MPRINKTYITNEFLQLMKKVDLKTSSRNLFFMMAMSAGLTLLPQELLAVENSIQAVQQGNEVEGVVKDASGEPIIGATVRVVGTKIATVTDMDGNFKINAKSGQSLQITYVGCKPKTVKVGGVVPLLSLLRTIPRC